MVAAPVRVERLEQDEALDLAQALSVRGLVGRPLRVRKHVVLEIRDEREDPERLLKEVIDALEAWLADRHRDALLVSVGDTQRTVRAARDLPATLAGRVPRRAKR